MSQVLIIALLGILICLAVLAGLVLLGQALAAARRERADQRSRRTD